MEEDRGINVKTKILYVDTQISSNCWTKTDNLHKLRY